MTEDITIQLERLPLVPNSGMVGEVFGTVYNTRVDDESITQLFERLKAILSKIIVTVDSVKEGKISDSEKQIESRLKSLNQEYRLMKDEYNELKQRFDHSEEEIKSLRQQVDDKREELKEIMNKAEKLSIEKEELLSATPLSSPISPFHIQTPKSSVLPAGTSVFDTLTQSSQMEEIGQALGKREEELQDYIQKYSKEYSANEQNKIKIEELELKLKNLTTEIDSYKDLLQKERLRCDQFYDRYNSEVEKNKVTLKTLEETYNTFKEKMKQEILEVKKENKTLKDTVEKLNKEKTENALAKQNEQLLQKKKDQVDKYNKLKYRYEKAKQTAEELKVFKQDKEEIIRQLNMYKKRNEELAKKYSVDTNIFSSESSSEEPSQENQNDPTFLKNEIVKWREQSEMFESSLNETIQLFEKLQQEKDEVTKKVDRAEEQRLDSLKEKVMIEKNIESVKEEMKRIADTCTEHEKLKKQYEEKIATLTAEKNLLNDILEKNKTEEIQFKRFLDQQRQLLDHYKQSVPALQTELEQAKSKIGQLIQELERKENEFNKQSLTLKRLNEEKIRLEKANATAVSSGVDDSSLQYYKRKVICSQCNAKEVDHVICRCFHTFCKDCITTNIKSRNRKCPLCGGRYDANDVKQFYLN